MRLIARILRIVAMSLPGIPLLIALVGPFIALFGTATGSQVIKSSGIWMPGSGALLFVIVLVFGHPIVKMLILASDEFERRAAQHAGG